jgi:hypothetical protein
MLRCTQKQVNEWHSRRDAFRKLYLQDPKGCVPEEFIGDDILYAIKGKFYWPLNAVREQLEKEFGSDPPMWVYVDPCYDDTTYALLTLGNELVLFSYGSKPWTFWWENEQDMKKDLEIWYEIARGRYQKYRPLTEKEKRK